ncbi:MAG: winged helix-turn-helix domain-containing protein [Halobacteria archaeon]|nr:winged helix-turn-helix domain-containing protein [Halobacteria archaeon]
MGQKESDPGYIMGSKHRLAVVEKLSDGPAIPKQIKEETDRPYSRISDALNDLRENDIVELLVSEDQKKGRLYGLTERGETALEYMKNKNLV